MMYVDIREIKEGYTCIYKLNFPNGKIYIGQTINLKRRMWEHNNPSTTKQPVDKAINKYGKMYVVEILETPTKESLDDREAHYINLYNSNHRDIGYNILRGGSQNCSIVKRKLSREQVYSIRQRFANGEDYVKLRDDFVPHIVSSTCFNRVLQYQTYCEIGLEFRDKRTLTREEKIAITVSSTRSGGSVFTREDVLFIRDLYQQGNTHTHIWRSFYKERCGVNAVRSVCLNETYKDIK